MEALLPLGARAPFTSDGPPAQMTRADMAPVVGRYENRGHFELSVEKETLVLRQNEGVPLTVSKVGTHRFVAAGPQDRTRLRFSRVPGRSRPAGLPALCAVGVQEGLLTSWDQRNHTACSTAKIVTNWHARP